MRESGVGRRRRERERVDRVVGIIDKGMGMKPSSISSEVGEDGGIDENDDQEEMKE